MSMSKQGFVALADAIRQHNEYENRPKFTEDHLNTLMLFCRGQNHAFMSGRWLDYVAGECGPNGGAIKKGEENNMHKITLTNSFHNTEITVLSEYDSASETWYHIQEPIHAGYPTTAQRAKYRRVHNALCGSDDCQCGTVRS